VSDDRPQTPDCLDAETLAAFMDGRLEPREREAVEAHLAECEDCYEVWMESRAVATSAPARHEESSRRRRWQIGASLIAASVLGVAWLWPVLRPADSRHPALVQLTAAVGDARFSEARLNAEFAWGRPPSATRGGAPDLPVPINQAALTATTAPDSDRTVATLRVAAMGHLVLGKYDAAVRDLEAAVDLDPSDGLAHLDLGAALLERFRAAAQAIDAAQALEATERGLATMQSNPQGLFNRGLALEANGRLEDAIRAWDEYLAIDAHSQWANEARERRERIRARIGGGPLASIENLTPEGIRQLAEAEPWRLLDLVDRVLIPDWISEVVRTGTADISSWVVAAEALKAAGNDGYAHDLSQAVLQMSDETRRRNAAAALDALQQARAAFDRSQYQEAKSLARRAAVELRRAGLDAIDADMHAAFSQFFEGDRQSAVAAGIELGRLATARGYVRIAGRAAYMQGVHFTSLVDLRRGSEMFHEAVSLYRQAGDRSQVAATYSQLMELAASAGQVDDSWRYASESARHLAPVTRQRVRYMVLSNLRYRATQSGLLFTAVAMGPALQALVDSWGEPLYSADVALLQAGLHQRLGNTEAVKVTVATARSYAQALTDETARADYAQALAFVEARAFHSSEPHTALAALDIIIPRLLARNRSLQLAEAHLLRGRALLASGNGRAAETEWRTGLGVLEREQVVLANSTSAVTRADRQWDLYAALISHLRDNAIEALKVAELSKARALLAERNRREPDDAIADRSSWMPAGMTALVYAILPDELAVWTITRNEVLVDYRALPSTGLGAVVDRFVSDVVARGSSADGRSLERLLLPSQAVLDSTTHLILIPDGPLHKVPYGLLRVGDRRPLVEHAELSISPSMAWLKRTLATSPAAPPARRALLVGYGNAQEDLGLRALPRVTDKILRAKQIYGERATILLGADATQGAISRSASHHDILHLAGHALADSRHPWLSRIFIAPSAGRGSLSVSDIERIAFRPGSLVLLSACSTAAGTAFRGEGVISLARPFLAAGAVEVLASLWPVRDDDAERTLVAVHQHIASGATMTSALATVQRAILKESPSQWQPWVVLGAQTAR